MLLTSDSCVPLQTANVGDSAAVFCKTGQDPKTEFVKMTVDHRISDPGERKRLAALGIELGKNKTRLYGMNLSRCLGDHFIKSADLGFTAVPSVSEVMQLAPAESGLVVIASDGLWDVAEPGRVMEVWVCEGCSIFVSPWSCSIGLLTSPNTVWLAMGLHTGTY